MSRKTMSSSRTARSKVSPPFPLSLKCWAAALKHDPHQAAETIRNGQLLDESAQISAYCLVQSALTGQYEYGYLLFLLAKVPVSTAETRLTLEMLNQVFTSEARRFRPFATTIAHAANHGFPRPVGNLVEVLAEFRSRELSRSETEDGYPDQLLWLIMQDQSEEFQTTMESRLHYFSPRR